MMITDPIVLDEEQVRNLQADVRQKGLAPFLERYDMQDAERAAHAAKTLAEGWPKLTRPDMSFGAVILMVPDWRVWASVALEVVGLVGDWTCPGYRVTCNKATASSTKEELERCFLALTSIGFATTTSAARKVIHEQIEPWEVELGDFDFWHCCQFSAAMNFVEGVSHRVGGCCPEQQTHLDFARSMHAAQVAEIARLMLFGLSRDAAETRANELICDKIRSVVSAEVLLCDFAHAGDA